MKKILESTSSLCWQFGLSEEQRLQRLKLLDLTEEDKALAETLVENVIKPNIVDIVDEFYEKLMTDPTAYKFIGDAYMLKRLKKTQTKYLLKLGINFNTEAYFESRLRAGLAHAWVGLPLMTYQCGYFIQQRIIIHYIKAMVAENKEEKLINFLLKIIALDMSLAVETYHGLQMKGLSQSLDKMRDQHHQLKLKASTDSLTGVLTRAQILEDLNQCLKQIKNKSQRLAVILIDVDYFKQINDKYGHLAGDQVLKQIASRFKSAVRNVDSIGRIGGEEFLIILPDADRDVASGIAERVRLHVSSTPIKSENYLIKVSVSEGVTEHVEGDSAKALVARADRALYVAKQNGRDRVVVSEEETNA